jgi:hypothetical protein
MMAAGFEKGDFKPYTAITKIHLGALETDIQEGETVLFDGTTMRRGNDDEEITTLRAAIKVGWLVPEDSEVGPYIPQPADIKIHEAAPKDSKVREVLVPLTIQDEERDVGTVASRVVGRVSQGAPTGAIEKDADDSQVVGRMKNAAKSTPIRIDGEDRTVVKTLDNDARPIIEPKRVATGDVEEALAGEELVDLLPDAANADVPKKGISGEGRGDESELRAQAVTARGSSRVGGAEDGEIVGSVSKTTGVSATPSGDFSPEIIKAKLEVVRQFVPGFEWDMNKQWAKRAKLAVSKYGDNLPIINAILSIETEAVRKDILKRLYKD